MLFFIQKRFYPSMEVFLREALTLGCCIKVSNQLSVGKPKIEWLLRKLKIGQTRIFLAFAVERRALIFSWFYLDGVISCAKEGTIFDFKCHDIVVKAIVSSQRAELPLRRFGQIDPPSIYLVGPDDVIARKGFRQGQLAGPRISLINPPVLCNQPPFGDFKWINGEEILRASRKG